MTEAIYDTLDPLIARIADRLAGFLTNPKPRQGRIDASELVAPAPEAVASMSNRDLARYIDHTVLKPETTAAQIDQLCADARAYRFAAVCVNPYHIERCVAALAGSGVLVASVAGFPLGATTPEIKAFETDACIRAGAAEVDMVMNVGALRDGDYAAVRRDMEAVVDAATGRAAIKVIIETGFLTDEEKVAACLLARAAGVDFVKTSTGITTTGATVEDVRLMRRVVGEGVGVKAAGGIRDAAAARAMLSAGASRLGTSASLAIISASR